MIPPIFHSVWLGSNPFPEEFRFYRESWREHYPSWELRCWSDADDLSWLQNRAVFDRQPNWSGKSDVLRYELLWRFGGVYIDTDFQSLKNAESLFRVPMFSATEDGTTISIGIMGAEPGHPFFRYLIEHLDEWEGEHAHAGQAERTGPGFMTAMVRQYRRNGGKPPRIYPAAWFYPYHFTEPEKASGPWPHAFAVHHWAKSWWSESTAAPASAPVPLAARKHGTGRGRRCRHQNPVPLEIVNVRGGCNCRVPIYPCGIESIGRCVRAVGPADITSCQHCDHYTVEAST